MDLFFLSKIILIRHGVFDDGNDFLNQKGIYQIQEIKTNLQTNFSQNINYKIISSTGKRAMQSAEIFSGNNISFMSDQLIHKKDLKMNLQSIFTLLIEQTGNSNYLVVFTHGEFIKEFTLGLHMEYFFKKSYK